jgi:hypothetical protein
VVGLVLLLLGFGDWSGVESPGGAARVWFGLVGGRGGERMV